MTCKDCIYDEVCDLKRNHYYLGEPIGKIDDVEVGCHRFKNKTDFVEVVHAHWEIDCDGYYPYCSNCRQEPEGRVMSKFCPNCGAIMDENKKGEW